MLNRQLSVNFDNKDSFFYRILKELELYNLPSIPALIQQPPEKDKWKDMVSESVAEHWRESLVRDARCKTTLRFLAYENISIGEAHPVWSSTDNSIIDVRRVRSFTGMDIITGMDYRNGHCAMALCALNVFYLHKMYFCSHMNCLLKIKFISV